MGMLFLKKFSNTHFFVAFDLLFILFVFGEYIQPVRTKKEFVINQHETIQQRVDLALRLKSKYGFKLPLYADTMRNEFLNEYAGWPIQVFLIYNNKIKWNIQPKRPGYFDLNDLKSVLQVY